MIRLDEELYRCGTPSISGCWPSSSLILPAGCRSDGAGNSGGDFTLEISVITSQFHRKLLWLLKPPPLKTVFTVIALSMVDFHLYFAHFKTTPRLLLLKIPSHQKRRLIIQHFIQGIVADIQIASGLAQYFSQERRMLLELRYPELRLIFRRIVQTYVPILCPG